MSVNLFSITEQIKQFRWSSYNTLKIFARSVRLGQLTRLANWCKRLDHVCKRFKCARLFSGEDGPWAILETEEKSESQLDMATKLPDDNANELSVFVLGFPGFQSEEQWILDEFRGEGDPKQMYEFVIKDIFGGFEHKIASKVRVSIILSIKYNKLTHLH
mgnify:CR=1 FL=1